MKKYEIYDKLNNSIIKDNLTKEEAEKDMSTIYSLMYENSIHNFEMLDIVGIWGIPYDKREQGSTECHATEREVKNWKRWRELYSENWHRQYKRKLSEWANSTEEE